MSYPYRQIKVVVTGDVLTATDYNAEHQNHITYAVTEIGPVYSVKVYSATGDGVTDDRTNITTADAATSGGTLFFPAGTYLIGNNLTISSPVEFAAGAKLSVASGKAVTFSSRITAPTTQIFSGSGTVVIPSANVVFPEWWGALCDGANDDALAIQAASTALTKGGTVQFSSRTYTLKTAVTVATHSIVYQGVEGFAPGDYGGSAAIGTRLMGVDGTSMLTVNNVGYFTIRDMTLALAAGATSACTGLYLESTFNPRVDHVRITNFSTAIHMTASDDTYISNCYLTSVGSTVNPVVGIDIDGRSSVQNPSVYISNCISAHGTFSGSAYGYWARGTRINDIRMTNCEADACTYGFYLDGTGVLDAGYSGDIVLQGCAADGNVTYGFYVNTCNTDSVITIANGWAAGGSIGVYVATSFNVTVTGMQCYGPSHGIYVGATSKNCTIANNQCIYCGSNGIVVDGSPFCTVANNQVKANSGATVNGIQLISGATNCTISGNNINGTASSITTGILINTSCDKCTVAGNNVSTVAATTPYTLNLSSNTNGLDLTAGNTTGTGNLVRATSPTLVTPLLGTPTSGVLTNCSGTASSLTAGNVTTNANLTGVITSVGNATSIASQTGTGSKFVVDTSPTLVTPLLGTPTSGVLTNCTGTAASLTAGNVTTNANLTGVITSVGNATSIASQTGTGSKFVVDNGPTLIAPLLGTPASGALTNCTSIPVANATGTLGTGHGGTGQTALSALVPTIQKFTSSSGTYTTAANATWIRVTMVGGGGGGAGSGTASSSSTGGAGGNTTFGTTLLVANGGNGGVWNGNGGTGGTASLGTGPIGTALPGGQGQGYGYNNAAATIMVGGCGASSPLGGAGGGGTAGASGNAAATNTGSGGGGGATTTTNTSVAGCGGGAGGYVHAIITAPSASYAYAVGTAGTAGSAGTSGNAGGAGGSGYIVVEEHYI